MQYAVREHFEAVAVISKGSRNRNSTLIASVAGQNASIFVSFIENTRSSTPPPARVSRRSV